MPIYELSPNYNNWTYEDIDYFFNGKPSRYIIRAGTETAARGLAYANSYRKHWLNPKLINCRKIEEVGPELIFAKEVFDYPV